MQYPGVAFAIVLSAFIISFPAQAGPAASGTGNEAATNENVIVNGQREQDPYKRVICKAFREPATGSLIPIVRHVCASRRQWQLQEKWAQQEVRRMQRRSRYVNDRGGAGPH